MRHALAALVLALTAACSAAAPRGEEPPPSPAAQEPPPGAPAPSPAPPEGPRPGQHEDCDGTNACADGLVPVVINDLCFPGVECEGCRCEIPCKGEDDASCPADQKCAYYVDGVEVEYTCQ